MLTKDSTIKSSTGVSVTLKAGDGLKEVIAALNFAGPAHKTSVINLPTLQEIKNGSSIVLIPNNTVFIDDEIWRKAVTTGTVELGLNGIFKDITNTKIPNTQTDAVSIYSGYVYFEQGQYKQAPSQIKFDGSLFSETRNYTVRIKAAGYRDVEVPFTIADAPIPTRSLPLIMDPTLAHIGQDLTYTFTDDSKWRNVLTKCVLEL